MRTRIIYNNYNLWEDYAVDARELLKEERPDENITENEIWDKIYELTATDFDDEHERLRDFFTGHGYFLLRGTVGRWNGNHAAGYVFSNFDAMFYKATKDCDYVKMWDENGHFYLQCSHHDGTNLFEIKRITDKAFNFIENTDKPMKEAHTIVWNNNFLSSLPHYVHTVYGCKKYE